MYYEKLPVGILQVGAGQAQIIQGTKVTRATVLAEQPDAPVGSIYLSTDRAYQRIAAAGVEGDWVKLSATAAD